MTLSPTPIERISRARADLRIGLPIVLRSPLGIWVAASAETLNAERLADLRTLGHPTLAITMRRAETLKARAYDGDIARILLPDEVGLNWVSQIADPKDDLASPMKGPLATLRDGPADAHKAAIRLAKASRLLPAMVVVEADEAPAELTEVDVATIQDALEDVGHLVPVVSARVPLAVSEAGRLHIYRPENGGEEHYAVEIGRPPRNAPVLTRLHSACVTGDLFASLKCDCGPQLDAALAAMGAEGNGVLLYLNQEGRGIGLSNKMRAYSLQDQGFDTVEANHRLGFEDDERDFRIGADILRRMGFSKVRLLTNNPAKVDRMVASGIYVTERVPLKVGENPLNAEYLRTKAKKSGHLL